MGTTASARGVLFVTEVEAPMTETVVLANAGVEETVSVSSEVATPLGVRVTVAGEKLAVTPDGSPVALSVTGELKPFTLLRAMVLVQTFPGDKVTAGGQEGAMSKVVAEVALMLKVSELSQLSVGLMYVPT